MWPGQNPSVYRGQAVKIRKKKKKERKKRKKVAKISNKQ